VLDEHFSGACEVCLILKQQAGADLERELLQREA